MFNEPKTSDPKKDDDAKKRDADRDVSAPDSSAEFIQEMAESGTASELGTVKAASDAAKKEEEGKSQKKVGLAKDRSEKTD